MALEGTNGMFLFINNYVSDLLTNRDYCVPFVTEENVMVTGKN